MNLPPLVLMAALMVTLPTLVPTLAMVAKPVEPAPA